MAQRTDVWGGHDACTRESHTMRRPYLPAVPILALLVFSSVGCDALVDAKEKDTSDETKKGKKKKKRKKKAKRKRKNEDSLTPDEITAACKRAIDEKLDALAGDQKRCERDYRQALDAPNPSGKLDEVMVALGRYECTMDASSSSDFRSCMKDVMKGAKQTEGKKLTFKPVFLDHKNYSIRCSASVKRPGMKAQHLTKRSSSCQFDDAGAIVMEAADLKAASVAGKVLTVGKAKTRVTIAIDDLWPQMGFDERFIKSKTPLRVPIELTNEDGTWKGYFYFDARLLVDHMKKHVGKGFVLPGEDAGGDVGSTHLVIGGSMYKKQNQVVGSGTTLREVGKIALIEEKSRTTDTCRYTDNKGKVHSVKLSAKDAVVTIYERKTGRKLTQKTFKVSGSYSCKSSVAKKDLYKKTTKYLPSDGAAIGSWAKAELAK